MMSQNPVRTLVKIALFPIIVLFGDTSPDATPQSQRKALVKNLTITTVIITICSVLGVIHAAQEIERAIQKTEKRIALLETYGFSASLDLERRRLYEHKKAYNDYISKKSHAVILDRVGAKPKALPADLETVFPVLVVN